MALVVTGLLQAQEKFEIGLIAGGGYFNTGDLENEFEFTNTFTANGGVYFLKPVFKQQFVESGLLYNFRETANDESFLQVDISLNSLELPLNYGWKFNNGFILKAGVSGVWLLGKNIERDIKPNKLGINGQLGVGYDLNRIKVFLNYQHGINKADFMYRHGDVGLFMKYRRSLIKLDVNVPIFKF